MGSDEGKEVGLQDAETPEPSNPLWTATSEQLIQELQRRYAVGTMFLVRASGTHRKAPAEQILRPDVLCPWWGDPMTLYGIVKYQADLFQLNMVQGLWAPNPQSFPDDEVPQPEGDEGEGDDPSEVPS